MAPTASSHLTCLCGAISESGALLSDIEFPISSSEICHCNSCRYTTGSLGAAFPPLNASPSENALSKLTAYNARPTIIDYFCSTCGSHCFAFNSRSKKWFCLGGIIDPSPASKTNGVSWPEDIVQITQHDFVLDTVDGGLAPFFLTLNGRPIPTWGASSSENSPFDLPHETILSLPEKTLKNIPPPKGDSLLPAKCHCGGVSLLIKRANYPANSSIAGSTLSDPAKYKAFLCACRSCRLSTGISLVPIALIPPENIFNAATSLTDLKPIDFGNSSRDPDSNPGLELKHYWSSDDVCRSFCGVCGATVAFWCERRKEMVSLNVGILRAEEGALARRWLEWEWGRVSGKEECVDAEVCESWVRGKEVAEKTRV